MAFTTSLGKAKLSQDDLNKKFKSRGGSLPFKNGDALTVTLDGEDVELRECSWTSEDGNGSYPVIEVSNGRNKAWVSLALCAEKPETFDPKTEQWVKSPAALCSQDASWTELYEAVTANKDNLQLHAVDISVQRGTRFIKGRIAVIGKKS